MRRLLLKICSVLCMLCCAVMVVQAAIKPYAVYSRFVARRFANSVSNRVSHIKCDAFIRGTLASKRLECAKGKLSHKEELQKFTQELFELHKLRNETAAICRDAEKKRVSLQDLYNKIEHNQALGFTHIKQYAKQLKDLESAQCAYREDFFKHQLLNAIAGTLDICRQEEHNKNKAAQSLHMANETLRKCNAQYDRMRLLATLLCKSIWLKRLLTYFDR